MKLNFKDALARLTGGQVNIVSKNEPVKEKKTAVAYKGIESEKKYLFITLEEKRKGRKLANDIVTLLLQIDGFDVNNKEASVMLKNTLTMSGPQLQKFVALCQDIIEDYNKSSNKKRFFSEK